MKGIDLTPLNEIMQDMHQQLTNNFSDALEAYLKKNLAQFGYTFKTRDAFHDFLRSRVRRVEFEALEEVRYYLDYQDENNMGTLVGITHENRVRIDYSEMPNKITATIG